MGRDALKLITFSSCVLLFVLGIIVGISSSEECLLFPKSVQEVSANFLVIFATILCRNLIVGLMISILGLLTAGISTVTIIFWNALIIGRLFNVPLQRLWEVLQHFIFHGFFELTAFFLLGSIGLRGVVVFKELLLRDEHNFYIKLSISEFALPVILLLISAIIESALIVYV